MLKLLFIVLIVLVCSSDNGAVDAVESSHSAFPLRNVMDGVGVDLSIGHSLSTDEQIKLSDSNALGAKLSATQEQMLQLQFIQVIKKLATAAPELAAELGNNLSALMRLNDTAEKSKKSHFSRIMDAIEKIKNKLARVASEDLEYITRTRNICMKNKNQFFSNMEAVRLNMAKSNLLVDKSKVMIEKLKFHRASSEKFEVRFSREKLKFIAQKREEEDGYYVRKAERDGQRNVLGLAITLVCKFRSQRKLPFCIYLKSHPEVPVETGCWINLPECAKKTGYYKKFRDLDGEETANANVDEMACLKRAKYYFDQCGNSKSQVVTAKYRLTGAVFNYPRDNYADYEKRVADEQKGKSEKFRIANATIDAKRKEDDQKLVDKQFSETKAQAEADAKKAEAKEKQSSNGPKPPTEAFDNALMSLDLASNCTDRDVENRLRAELYSLVGMFRSDSDDRCRLVVRHAIALLDSRQLNKGSGKTLISILTDLRGQLQGEQDNDDVEWLKSLKLFDDRENNINSALDIEGRRQVQLKQDIRDRQSEVQDQVRALVRHNEEFQIAAKSYNSERHRCRDEETAYIVRSHVNSEEQLNIGRLISLLRAYESRRIPKCKGECVDPEKGSCIFVDRYTDNTMCACEYGYYGDSCEFKQCPGNGADSDGTATMFNAEDSIAVCSGNGTCDNTKGLCQCNKGYYHAENSACEKKECPNNCSGNGRCDTSNGECVCDGKYWGSSCEWKKCLNSNRILYPGNSASACDGRGACNPETGACDCQSNSYGDLCQYQTCPNDCLGRGECNKDTGECSCKKGYYGRTCSYKSCDENCGGRERGFCDRLSGLCTCEIGSSGPVCRRSKSCNATSVSWWTSFDKAGWSTCPVGMLLQGFYRNVDTCGGIYCLEMAQCATPCEGSLLLALDNCFYSNWYSTFNLEGWSECGSDYFLAGLYRSSCDSLYCIELALCCSVDHGTFQNCGTANWFTSFNSQGWSTVLRNKDDGRFMTKLFRGRGHTLDAIDTAGYCEFRRQPWKEPVKECPSDCSNQGECDSKTGVCSCKPGFTGPNCADKECPKYCSNNGNCNPKTGVCSCNVGYTSTDCSTRLQCQPPNDPPTPSNDSYPSKSMQAYLLSIDQSGKSKNKTQCSRTLSAKPTGEWISCDARELSQGLVYTSNDVSVSSLSLICAKPCGGLTIGTCRVLNVSKFTANSTLQWIKCGADEYLQGVHILPGKTTFPQIRELTCCKIEGQTFTVAKSSMPATAMVGADADKDNNAYICTEQPTNWSPASKERCASSTYRFVHGIKRAKGTSDFSGVTALEYCGYVPVSKK